MPQTTPSSGAAGVISTFPEKKPFGVSRTTSVKVPPISTASRQPSIISAQNSPGLRGYQQDFQDTNKPVTRTAHLVFDEGLRERPVPSLVCRQVVATGWRGRAVR